MDGRVFIRLTISNVVITRSQSAFRHTNDIQHLLGDSDAWRQKPPAIERITPSFNPSAGPKSWAGQQEIFGDPWRLCVVLVEG